MKPDQELLSSLTSYLRQHARECRSVSLQVPMAGLETADELARAVQLAKAKCFADNIVCSEGPRGLRWTFELTTRGAEALGLD